MSYKQYIKGYQSKPEVYSIGTGTAPVNIIAKMTEMAIEIRSTLNK